MSEKLNAGVHFSRHAGGGIPASDACGMEQKKGRALGGLAGRARRTEEEGEGIYMVKLQEPDLL